MLSEYKVCLFVLVETNVGSLFSERLSADVEAILSDNSVTGSSDTAIKKKKLERVIKSYKLLIHTTDGSPCRKFWGGNTKRSREPFCLIIC